MIEQTNTSRPGAILQSKSQPISATVRQVLFEPFPVSTAISTVSM